MEDRIDEIFDTVDNVWLLITSFLILSMQVGFAMMEMGMTSLRCQANLLLKNVLHLVVGAAMTFATGWALSRGGTFPFAGNEAYFLIGHDSLQGLFFYCYTSAATTCTIFSGAVTGRMKFGAYVAICILITGFLHPIAGHWTWDEHGWLNAIGFQDVEGSGNIHILGSAIGLAGAIVLKPRIGVFTSTGRYVPPRSSPANVVIGLFTLIAGWYPYVAGALLTVHGGMIDVCSRTVDNTAIGLGYGSIASLLFSMIKNKGKINIFEAATGTFAALVSVMGVSAYVKPWVGVVVGIIGALMSFLACRVLIRLRVDDPMNSIAVNLTCGVWSLVAIGIFSYEDPITGAVNGLLYGGGFRLLGIQCVGVLAIFAWGFGLGLLFFYGCKRFITNPRVRHEVELQGLDLHEHDLLNIMLSLDQESDATTGGLVNLAGKVNHLGLSMRRVGEEVFVTRKMLKHMSKHPSIVTSPVSPPGASVDGSEDVVARLSCMLGTKEAVHGATEGEGHLAVIDLTRLPRASAAVISMLADGQQLQRESESDQWAIPVPSMPEKKPSVPLSLSNSLSRARTRIIGSMLAASCAPDAEVLSTDDDAVSEKEIKLDSACVLM